MKQDINTNLLFLIGVIITATVLLTLYFSHSVGNVNVDYNQLEDKYESTFENLTSTTAQLNTCNSFTSNLTKDINESKTLEQKSRDEYNKIYEETEGELTKTQSTLKETKDTLDNTVAELQKTTNDLNAKTAALSTAENKINTLEKQIISKDNMIDNIEACAANNDIECVKGALD
jgi:chromosome segregation ATPase